MIDKQLNVDEDLIGINYDTLMVARTTLRKNKIEFYPGSYLLPNSRIRKVPGITGGLGLGFSVVAAGAVPYCAVETKT